MDRFRRWALLLRRVVAATGSDKKNVGGVKAVCVADWHWRCGQLWKT
jgi:hypothetical protein